MTRQEFWQQQYQMNRYMEYLSHEDFLIRAGHIFNNMSIFQSDGKVGIHRPSTGGEQWLMLWTHLLEEFNLRGKGMDPRFVRQSGFPPPNDPLIKRAMDRIGGSLDGIDGALYKLGHSGHMEDLFHHGLLKISPASSYDDSSLNDAIKDDELSLGFRLRADHCDLSQFDGSPIPADGYIDIEITSRTNYYVQCFSAQYSHRLFFDFKYDACIVIHDAKRLLRELHKATVNVLPTTHYFPQFAGVQYLDPLTSPVDKAEPLRGKHFKYYYQCEARMIWAPLEPAAMLEPIYVEIGSMFDYAELITI